MRPRKTIDVEKVKLIGNSMLAGSHDDMTLERVAISTFLEQMLHATGNYNGYGYLRSEYLPAKEQTATKVLRDGYDETRRHYY